MNIDHIAKCLFDEKMDYFSSIQNRKTFIFFSFSFGYLLIRECSVMLPNSWEDNFDLTREDKLDGRAESAFSSDLGRRRQLLR